MTRSEWLNDLQETLIPELPRNEIDNNLSYYRDYIQQECETKSESEVLANLGEPRLIGKTIIDTYQMQRGMGNRDAYSDHATDYNYDDVFEKNRAQSSYTDMTSDMKQFQIKPIRWYHKLAVGGVLLAILATIIIVGSFLLRIVLTLALPVLLIVLLFRLIRRS